jgi:hypothetical protein
MIEALLHEFKVDAARQLERSCVEVGELVVDGVFQRACERVPLLHPLSVHFLHNQAFLDKKKKKEKLKNKNMFAMDHI